MRRTAKKRVDRYLVKMRRSGEHLCLVRDMSERKPVETETVSGVLAVGRPWPRECSARTAAPKTAPIGRP